MSEYEVLVISGSMNWNAAALRGMLNDYAKMGYELVAVTVINGEQIFYLRQNGTK